MRIALGSDHAGYDLKALLVSTLEGWDYEVLDVGTANATDSVDYPDFGAAVGRAVTGGNADLGVAVCGSGIGISIAANKVPGVRAALCGDVETARGARQWNDANVLALSLRLTTPELGRELMEAFFANAPDGSEADQIALLA